MFVPTQPQGAHTRVVDRFVWIRLVQTQVCFISCRTSDQCSFCHIWQSSPPSPPHFQTLNGLFMSMEEVRVTLCRRKVENLSVYGPVRFRFARMIFEQRNSAWIETESAQSAAEVSSLVVLYGHVKRGGGKGKKGWGRLSNIAEWATIACPTRDNTNLGLNRPYSNKSVHNSCMGSLWYN